jgi:hypothetical protein
VRGTRDPRVTARRKRVLEGRTKGVPYRDLAAEFGISEATARKDFTRALSTTQREAGEAYVHLYREQLDAITAGLFAIFGDRNGQHRDRVAAGRELVRVLERSARFLGADKTAAAQAEQIAADTDTASGILGNFAMSLDVAYRSLTPTPDQAGDAGTTDGESNR